MRRTVAACLFACIALVTLADNLAFKNGRLDEGKVSILKIEAQQYITIRTKRVMVLTPSQKAILKKEAGVAPTVLEVYTVKGAEAGIHACFAFNLAVWFEPDSVEVPHKYLVTDEQAEKRSDEMDSM